MAKRINYASLENKIQNNKQHQHVEKNGNVKNNSHHDLKYNITRNVANVFKKLPGVEKAIYKRAEAASNGPTEERRKASNNLESVKSISRKHNPDLLSEGLINDVITPINADSVNAKFMLDLQKILANSHKHLYKKNTEKMSWENKNKLIFSTILRVLGNNIATHKRADLDGLATLKILKECGVTDKSTYVNELNHKDSKKGYVHVDVGGVNGIHVENLDASKLDHTSKTAYKKSFYKMIKDISILVDHHHSQIVDGKTSHGATSTSYIVFNILKSMNYIPDDKYDDIVRFVKFVDIVDTAGIEVVGADFDYSPQTLVGLHRLILKDYKNIDFIYDYLNGYNSNKDRVYNPKTGLEVMKPEYMKNTMISMDGEKKPLIDLSIAKKAANEKSYKIANDLLDAGKYLESPLNKEGFIVDLNGELVNGPEVSNHLGYGLIKLLPDGQLFIYSPAHMDLTDAWPEFGDYTRGHILFVDTNKVQDWSRFEKALFNDEANRPILDELRAKILSNKNASKNKEKQKIQQSGVVKGIIHGYIQAFVKDHPLPENGIQINTVYPALVNNVRKDVVFLTIPGGQTAVIKRADIGGSTKAFDKEVQNIHNVMITKMEMNGDKCLISAVPTKEVQTTEKIIEQDVKTG